MNRWELTQLDNEYLQKPTANIKLDGEKLQAFLLRQEQAKYFPPHHSFSTLYWKW